MSDLLSHPGLPWYLISGVCIGLSKAGLGGMAMVSVALMAQFFGKDSIGIVLPLLIIADLMVYPRLSRAGSWKDVRPLLAPAVIGVLLGALLVGVLDDTTARKAIGWPLIVMIVMKVGMDRLFTKARDWHKIPFFHTGCGLMAGIVTMLANAAGPITTLYLLEKKNYESRIPRIGGAVLFTHQSGQGSVQSWPWLDNNQKPLVECISPARRCPRGDDRPVVGGKNPATFL
jgi:uncharacterized membrane protein YfcA